MPTTPITCQLAPEALRASAFDLSPNPALVFTHDGVLRLANEAAERFFGQALGHLQRVPLQSALPSDSGLPALMQRAAREGSVIRERRIEVVLPDHPPFDAEVAAAPLPGGLVQLSFTPLVQLSASDRTADTLRSVAGMGRTLAHEIKNPLAGIRGAAQLLSAGASAEDATLAQLIVDETDRIRRLIDRVEAFSDERAPSRQPVNIHRILDRVRVLMTAGAGDRLTFRETYDPSLPHAWGDEDQLIQVFLNLVKNAAEAANSRGDGRGEVTIGTGYRHNSPSAPLEVRVQDNGPGIPADLRERLFHPFVTTKATGAGLGLTLVAKLVADHQGTIDFDSEPGRTVFRVLLPRRASNSTAATGRLPTQLEATS
ncbi:MAG: ATP-binding protein [Pseudomonadota bacterium]|nr:ATP-binding protein [Pseudomonadota bacterium]